MTTTISYRQSRPSNVTSLPVLGEPLSAVSQRPAMSTRAQREVLPSTKKGTPVLYWAGRVATHSSLRPVSKPANIFYAQAFSLFVESMPIAR
jgi:hypothetical protein